MAANILLSEGTRSAKDVCAFEDYDSLEGGLSREFLAAELLSPSSSNTNNQNIQDLASLEEHSWLLCRLTRPQKDEFRLCNEKSGQFMLSAKQVGDDFYISAYEDMRCLVSHIEGTTNQANYNDKTMVSSANYAAILSPHSGPRQSISYRLHLCTGTQRCFDNECNAEPLIEVWPSAVWSQEQQVELRRLRLRIPTPRTQTPAHYIHDCASPTSLRPSHPGFFKSKKKNFSYSHSSSPTKMYRKTNVNTISSSPNNSPAHTTTRFSNDCTKNNSICNDNDDSFFPEQTHLTLQNKLPKWNSQLGCLSLHFGRKRVKASSSKNFLIYTDSTLSDTILAESADQAVFQLGKLASRTFSLDFRYPLSPLQAFAIALTAFNAKRVPKFAR